MTDTDNRADFYHATNKENFTKMLRLGRLESLAHLAKRSPRTQVNVEPNRWDRERTRLPVMTAIAAS